ncbi:MAG: redoxin domain-containing protein [Bacteroidota bacterium]
MRLLFPILALVLAPLASAQDSLALGSGLPLASESFATAEGGSTSLGAAMGESGLAVVFWSAACPWTEKYESRVSEIAETASGNGVGLVLVASNDPERTTGDSPEALAATARRIGASILLDPTSQIADAFGARQTPQAFFFGPSLLYSGAIDDSPAEAARVTIPYLAQAMEQSLAGQSVEIERTTAFGCTIKRPR